MGCCGGDCDCYEADEIPPVKCQDCGLYGSACCMVASGTNPRTGLPETWVFSNDPSNPTDIVYSDDDCLQDSHLQFGGSSNLCGGMRSVQPCSLCGPDLFFECAHGYQAGGVAHGFRVSVRWETRSDCSLVDFYFSYCDGSVDAYGYAAYVTHTTTLPLNWLAPFVPFTCGPFTFSTCTPELPLRPLYDITCLEAVRDGIYYKTYPIDPGGRFGTELCGAAKMLLYTDGVYSGDNFVYVQWETKPDYSQICFNVDGCVTCIDYDPVWWSASLELPSGSGCIDGTVTIAACGVIDLCPPGSLDCFPDCISGVGGEACDEPTHALMFVDIDEDLNCCLSGSWNMPFDGTGGYHLPEVGGPVGTCGTLEMWMYCDGSDIKLRVRRVDGDGSVHDNTSVITLTCDANCDVSYTFNILSVGGGGFCQAGGLFEGARVTISSNRGGC